MVKQQTRRIRAVSDDGREFVILEYNCYRDRTDGRMCRIPGLRAFVTEECIPVYRVGEEIYEVLTEPEPALARTRGGA